MKGKVNIVTIKILAVGALLVLLLLQLLLPTVESSPGPYMPLLFQRELSESLWTDTLPTTKVGFLKNFEFTSKNILHLSYL